MTVDFPMIYSLLEDYLYVLDLLYWRPSDSGQRSLKAVILTG